MSLCAFCGASAQYRDRTTGEYICLEHARLEVIAAGRRVTRPAAFDSTGITGRLSPHRGAGALLLGRDSRGLL